jgi:hypothetical protein
MRFILVWSNFLPVMVKEFRVSFDENLYGGTLTPPTSNPSYCENSVSWLKGDYSGGVGSKNIDSSTKGVNCGQLEIQME